MTLQVGEITAGGAWSVGYEGAYVGGEPVEQYPYTCPFGDVDSKSLFNEQKFGSGATHRITANPSLGTLDASTAEAESLWGNDVNDIYTPPGGYTGEVTISLERIETDDAVSAWTVTMTVEDGVVIGVSFKRPIKRSIKQSIKRSTLQ